MFRCHTSSRLAAALLGLAAALVTGCAGLRCPRIDPTGERCLIWPKDQPPVPAIAPPSNPVAPPVGTDPYFPQVPVTAAPAGAAVTPASASLPEQPRDALSITPARVLAPVGSEVVLKASICTSDGYTLADQKIEWMLGRNGVGQFVEVGGKGVFHPPLFPWNGGKKVDNYLANGYTANGPLCITRGTADPSDDINVNRGDAWISLTSPNEGASHVTAYTPAVESWDQRKAVATVYWVDVQWVFPPPMVASAGQGETITTVVTRQSDGTPLAGWVVRYEVADAGGSESGVREVVTGADGRAAAQVSPTASGAASSQINVQLIRPAGLGGGDAPRLIVASGTTTVQWNGGSTYLPPVTTAPAPTTPSVPSATPPVQQLPPTPQPQLPPGVGARLELQLEGPTAAVVGDHAPLRVILRNTGDAPATNVSIRDDFNPAFYSPLDPSSRGLRKDLGTIHPGQVYDETLPFQVNKSGELCHQIAVSFEGGSPVSRSHCVNASDPPPQREARVEVRMEAEPQRIVGETATFNIVVRNVGQTPLVNIETVEDYTPASVFQPIPAQNAEVINNTVRHRIARLEVGQASSWQTQVRCLRPASRVGPTIELSAQTDPPTQNIRSGAEHYLEVLDQRNQPSGGQGPPPTQPPTANSPLGLAVTFLPSPTRVGTSATCDVALSNRSMADENQVSVRVVFPPEVAIDATRIQGPPNAPPQISGNTVTFGALAAVRPGELVRYVIPITPRQAGVVTVTVGAISRNVPQSVSVQQRLEILSNAL